MFMVIVIVYVHSFPVSVPATVPSTTAAVAAAERPAHKHHPPPTDIHRPRVSLDFLFTFCFHLQLSCRSAYHMVHFQPFLETELVDIAYNEMAWVVLLVLILYVTKHLLHVKFKNFLSLLVLLMKWLSSYYWCFLLRRLVIGFHWSAFLQYWPRYWLGRISPIWPILYQMEHEGSTHAISLVTQH